MESLKEVYRYRLRESATQILAMTESNLFVIANASVAIYNLAKLNFCNGIFQGKILYYGFFVVLRTASQ